MVASRVRVLRASNSARFWLSAFCIALMPTSIGYQDLATALMRQPAIFERGHNHLNRRGHVAEAMVRLSQLIADVDEIAELDINPLLAGPKGAVAADALVVLS